ncbi:MAG: carbohydrate-binding domain-containing protein [Prevotella sp.]|nr:carbohydrate-binding domain-containing protein [Prevotella sp.]MBR1388449.1 carbohydrate-binding domain-containing protein [Prevotella sp.]
MIIKRLLYCATLLAIASSALAVDDNTVEVTFSSDKATVTIADNISSYVTSSVDGANVKLTQAETVTESAPGEITYILSGSTTNGSFYLSGSYKATVTLNGLTLTNPQGAAIDIQNGKRINVRIEKETTNTLTDGEGGDWKGCFVCKGHTEFKGKGTLTVNGKTAHGIWSKEYVEIKNCTINVESAVKDGINCNEYFLMESGTVNITGPGDDGIQVSLKDETSTGTTTDHEDEDSGNFYMADGTLKITGHGGVCIKADGSITYSGGTQDFNTSDVVENAATGISRVTTDTQEEGTAVYDLSGRRLPQDLKTKGIVIVKEKGGTRKVIR